LLAADAGPVLPFLYWASIWPPIFFTDAPSLRKLAKYAGQASCQLLIRVCWVENVKMFSGNKKLDIQRNQIRRFFIVIKI
jgi:hypothetical protein